LDLIEATHELCTVHQLQHHGSTILPIQIRLEADRLNFIGELIFQEPELLQNREYLETLALKLKPKSKESKAELCLILANSAVELGYHKEAYSVCRELIGHLEVLERRSELNAKAAMIFSELASERSCIEDDLKSILASRAIQFTSKANLESSVRSWKSSWLLETANGTLMLNGHSLPLKASLLDAQNAVEEIMPHIDLVQTNVLSHGLPNFYHEVGSNVQEDVGISVSKALLGSYLHLLSSSDAEDRKADIMFRLGRLLLETDTFAGISFLLNTEMVYKY
jgi:hypothetical protein